MEEQITLTSENALMVQTVIWGEPLDNMDVACLLLVDVSGKKFFTFMGCKPNFRDSINKSFTRLVAVRPPQFVEPERKTYEETKQDYPQLLTEEQKEESIKEGSMATPPPEL